jgi:hypothetical protein
MSMSTHRIRTLVPATVTAPRGADACATAAAALWIASAEAVKALRRALGRRRAPARSLVVSKSHA